MNQQDQEFQHKKDENIKYKHQNDYGSNGNNINTTEAESSDENPSPTSLPIFTKSSPLRNTNTAEAVSSDANSTPISTPTSARSSLPGSCIIPEHPENGKYSIRGISEGSYNPGDYAVQFSTLTIKCNPRYNTNPLQKGIPTLCIDGKWTTPPPACFRSCPIIKLSATIIVKCSYQGHPLQSCDDPIEGTIANLQCNLFYEEPKISREPFRNCRNGMWDYPIPECVPICGEKRPIAEPHVIGGQIAKFGDYPWHIGIYTTNKRYICGGSLINQRVVLSAAHCFTNYNGDLHPKENYSIAAGKYYRDYSDPRDEKAQYSNISKIYIPEKYRGTTNNFEADIAVVILETKLNLSSAVQPVCVDWQTAFEYQQLQENNVGIVIGWNFATEGGDQSEELKEVYVAYNSKAECLQQIPEQFQKFLTHDKTCASYRFKGKSFCQHNSGEGLTFEWNQNRYYIRGIVSTLSSNGTGIASCINGNQYGIYTLVSKYIDFIKNLEVVHKG